MTLKRDHRRAGCVSPERPGRDTDSANASERGLSFCIRNWVGPASDAKPGLAYTWGIGRGRMHFMANTRDLGVENVGSIVDGSGLDIDRQNQCRNLRTPQSLWSIIASPCLTLVLATYISLDLTLDVCKEP